VRATTHSRPRNRRSYTLSALVCTLIALLWTHHSARAQATPDLTPTVPVTKVLAIGRLVTLPMTEATRKVLPEEVRDTVQLYLQGKIDQWYVQEDQSGVVFMINTSKVEDARRILDTLPLSQEHLMTFQLIGLGPLSPLGALIKQR
jgi:hypothetical protein